MKVVPLKTLKMALIWPIFGPLLYLLHFGSILRPFFVPYNS